MVAQPPARTRMESNLPVLSRASSAEESNGSAEGRVRKLQRTSGTDTKAPFRGRRPSVREHKAPLGPRPYEKQRVASGAGMASQNRVLPPTSDASRFSFTAQPQPEPPAKAGGRFDLIPDVTFDDFANSLAYEPTLSNFPAPPDSSSLASVHMASQTQHQFASSGLASSTHAPPTLPSNTDARPARSASLIRRFSQSKSRPVLPNAPAETSSTPPSGSGMSIRTRRQSQFPSQAPPNPAARAPRKSVGPGMLPTPSLDARQEIPRLASDSVQTRVSRTSSFSQGNRRGTLPPTLNLGAEPNKVPSAARSAKAKSLHAPLRQQPGMLTAPVLSDQTSTPLAQSRSPARSTARTQTPSSSSSKRQSTMHHVGGLGARTISPTDARRLKRLSMNPNPPGGPISPPTPQAEFSFDERSFNQSPAMIFRKSVTPSSARATPDQNRKSYTSGISISSNSSLNSLRVGNSTLQTRANPALTGSRLPTAKPRNVHSSAGGDEEEVPPVPAIPKAYESPKDPEHSTFTFSTSSLKPGAQARTLPERIASDDVDTVATRGVEAVQSGTPKSDSAKKNKSTIRHRRGLTVGAGSDADKSPVVQNNKKDLQPIRLPPLNLLPLGTPFNSRISSLPAPSAEIDNRNTTPPPKRATNKTPSTPMTASKVSFFSKSGHGDRYDGANHHLRSSSSAYNLRAAEPSLQGVSAMPIPTLHPTRQITTPFSSNSLPKGSGEYARLYSQPSGEYKLSDTDVELESLKLHNLRTHQKDASDSAQTSTSTEPETPSSGSSLRRKLSLSGWRRASSKATAQTSHASQARHAPQKHEEQAPQAPKHGEMPPPRLPASATWSGSLGASPTPANRTRPSLDFGRRKAPTAAIASDTEAEKTHGHKSNITMGVRVPSGYAEQSSGQSTPKSSSILTPVQRILGSKSSTNMLRARNLDPNLDRDDQAADEEMKKLASKRKDFEHAARDVDDLRKRARPQERVTAAQALQMVALNIFERGEIIDYKEIYFCGTKSAKKHVGDLNATTANFGYDDDRGDYNIVLGDHLAYRYEVVDVLGKGSFGQVVRCVDHKTGALVAIKIIRNKKRFHQQALVEVNILQKLREWDPDNKHSMINFTQSFYFRGHLCISTELLGMNLYEFIKAHEFKGFSLRLIRRFCKQMLSSLVLLKSHRVIHCDLKPENILLAHPLHSEIKVIDFGSSCFENEKVYTYIQSRFYRSPEVILGMSYGLPIDMWSLGCILAELLTGYPIFPGENEQEQLACIMEIFGPPEKHLIEKSSRKKLFFDSMGKPRVTVSTKGRRRRPSSRTLQQALKCDDDAFLDFIARCLRWDPERRMKPDEAMLHEFITGVKRAARPRPQANGTSGVSSPVKRVASSQTPSQRARPLPEPPVTSLRSGPAVAGSREVSGSSPVKPAAPRRLSTVPGAQGAAGVKRSVNGAPLNATSSLPRVAQRTASGKSDLAAAAALASIKSSR